MQKFLVYYYRCWLYKDLLAAEKWGILDKCRWKGRSEAQQSRRSGCCLKSYERLVIIQAHLWKLAAGFLHTKSQYTDFLPHYQFTFENKILCLSIQISPHLVSSHINLCNFVSGHWNAGWRKSKRVSRNWWPSKSNKDSLLYNSDFSQL
jgi:hypothetical protein